MADNVQGCGQDKPNHQGGEWEPKDSVVTTESEVTTTEHSKSTTTTTYEDGDGGEEPKPEPSAEVVPDESDETGRTAKLAYVGFPEGKVTVTWGDVSDDEKADGPEGELTHYYDETVEGPEVTITVTAEDDTSVTATTTFTLEEVGS